MKDYLEKQSAGYDKVFLLHLPKSAGTYIDYLFSGENNKNQKGNGGNWLGRKHCWFLSEANYLHITGRSLGWKSFKNLGPGWDKKWEASKLINKQFIFSIIRNPFDMLASYYFHTHGNNHRHPDGWSNSNRIHNFKSFKEFIQAYCDPNYKIPGTNIDWHVPLLKDFLYSQMFNAEGECKVHFVLKYEHLDEGLKLISERFNLDYSTKDTMSSSVNTGDGTKRNGSVFKSKNYKDYYDKEMIDLVNKKCWKELKISNYDFNGSTNNLKYADFSNVYYNPIAKAFKTNKKTN